MKYRFSFFTVILGVLTGASTLAMLSNWKTSTYIPGIISIIAFLAKMLSEYILSISEEEEKLPKE